MLRVRIFPCLLLQDAGLVKTVKFKDPTYVGDPINAVRIFNTKEVDELVLLDISATEQGRTVPVDLIKKISDECRMPLSVGGGIKKLKDVKALLALGVEKVVINTRAIENISFIEEVAKEVGSQSIIVSIDAKKGSSDAYEVFSHGGSRSTGLDPIQLAKTVEKAGAGEIFLNSIDQDGTMMGFDIELIKAVATSVNVPLIACGGAGSLNDIREAVHAGGASAVSCGSMFVFHGPRKAVLINFPTKNELETALSKHE